MTATIELNSARRKLQTALGDNQKDYFTHMKSWFRKRCTKEEFDQEARKLLPPDQSHLHNEFLLAILNKCQTLASFTLVTSPTSASNSAKNLTLPSSPNAAAVAAAAAAAAAASAATRVVVKQQDLDGRLKIGPVKRRTKSNRATFDQRLQQQQNCVPDVDDLELYEPDERLLRFAHKEPTLPDVSLIGGRLLVAAWEEGLDGSVNDPAASQLMVAAVDQLLKKIIMALLMDRSGYKVYSNNKRLPYAVGIKVPDPWLNNTQRRSTVCGGNEDGLREIDVLEPLNGSMASNNVDPLVPVARPQQKDAEHAAMLQVACASSSSNGEANAANVSLFDLMTTLQKHRNLIPSHTVMAVNMERLICRLHHKGHDD